MQDSPLVCEVDRPRDVEQAGHLRPSRLARSAGQRCPLHITHREVLLPLVLAHLVDRHDVRMVERGR